MPSALSPALSIVRLSEIPDDGVPLNEIDGIFFEASNTKSFESPEARDVFRERWLGRYLAHDPQWFYVAMSGNEVSGYLAGSLDDPALTPRFADISYFAAFKNLTRRFPAHLHVNLRPQSRGLSVGGELVARFSMEAAAAGASGVHVVTSPGSRNVRFYERNGFTEQGRCGSGLREVVFLGRPLRRIRVSPQSGGGPP